MKKIKIFLVLVLIYPVSLSPAQELAQDQNLETSLSPEQKRLLSEYRKSSQELKTAFKASLSEEQLAILKNKDLSPKDRISNFKASFSETQKDMLQNNREALKTQRQAFRMSLSEDQGQNLRSSLRKYIRKRNIRRARLRRRLLFSR